MTAAGAETTPHGISHEATKTTKETCRSADGPSAGEGGTQRPGRTQRLSLPLGLEGELGREPHDARSGDMRLCVLAAFAFFSPLTIGRARPPARWSVERGVSAQRGGATRRFAACGRTGRFCESACLILPPGYPTVDAEPSGCLRVPGNLRVPSSAPKGRNPEAA